MRIGGEKAIKRYGGEDIVVSNAADMPDTLHIKEMFEPVVNATIITPGIIFHSSIEILQYICVF